MSGGLYIRPIIMFPSRFDICLSISMNTDSDSQLQPLDTSDLRQE